MKYKILKCKEVLAIAETIHDESIAFFFFFNPNSHHFEFICSLFMNHFSHKCQVNFTFILLHSLFSSYFMATVVVPAEWGENSACGWVFEIFSVDTSIFHLKM